MNLADRDLFELWRLLLGTTCCIYAIVIMFRSIWRWCLQLSGSDRRSTMIRRYAVVQLLRVRFGRFSREFARIGVLLFILAALLWGHT